ncbi:DUF4136 domain-containing protein [Pontibacter mangrovi]|nr:DUF4136 domain-containing protein [Pontibacter mangrovi]
MADIEIAYPQTTDFDSYKTFNLYSAEVPKPRVGGSGPQYNSLLDQYVRQSIGAEMRKSGFQLDVVAPDLLVAYDIAVDTSKASSAGYKFPQGFGYGYSFWYGYRFRYDTSTLFDFRPIDELPAGTLVIDIIDPATNELLWRCYADAYLDPSTQDEEYVKLVVEDILSEFPPAS